MRINLVINVLQVSDDPSDSLFARAAQILDLFSLNAKVIYGEFVADILICKENLMAVQLLLLTRLLPFT